MSIVRGMWDRDCLELPKFWTTRITTI